MSIIPKSLPGVPPQLQAILTQLGGGGGVPGVPNFGGDGGGYGGGPNVAGAFGAPPAGGFGLPGAIPSTLGAGGQGPIGTMLPVIGGSGDDQDPFGWIGKFGGGIDKANPWVKKQRDPFVATDISPIYGDYKGATDATGALGANYGMGAATNLASQMGDATGLAELRTRATQKGPSAWAQMAAEGQQLDEQNMLGQAAQAQAGQLAGARSNLAMRGGLRGGASERLATAGSENALLGGQGIRNQGMQGRLGIGMQDESNKLNLLSQLPGAELGQAGYLSGLDQQNVSNKLGVDQFNISNSLADLGAKNQWQKDLAGLKVQAEGAAQTATATQNAGKK